MRTTPMTILCSLAACAAEVGHHGGYQGSPDGGVAANCTNAQTVTGDYTITGASGFRNIPTGCWNLTGKLQLSGSSITSVAQLGDLRHVDALELDGTALARFDSKSPVEVAGSITIHNNAQLTDVANIVTMDAATLTNVIVDYNPQLTKLALPRVTRVTGALAIGFNDKLTTVDLSRAARLEDGAIFCDNAVLATLNLSALQSVGPLTIRHNAALASLGSLAALQFVHGDLTIDNNAKLDLAGYTTGTIQHIDGSLVITNNTALTGVGQLTHAGGAGVGVAITGNSQLDYCPAKEIGCCVAHRNYASIANNTTTTCTQHSWCWTQQQGCPYLY
jgi:hypothetical protein